MLSTYFLYYIPEGTIVTWGEFQKDVYKEPIVTQKFYFCATSHSNYFYSYIKNI